MQDFRIELIWAKVQAAITALGGWLGYFIGGMDGLMIALLIFMILDYITGIMCAIIDHELSSAVGLQSWRCSVDQKAEICNRRDSE